MAVKYLRSGAAGAGTGADWTDAYTTLVAALAGVAAGDTIYVADDHAETQTGTMALTSPGTAGNPVRIVCVNTHVTTPPTATATSATITTTTTGSITFAGYSYLYGITFNVGSGAVSSSCTFGNNVTVGVELDTCAVNLVATASANLIQLGGTASSIKDCFVRLRNTNVSFAATGQSIRFAGTRFSWQGGAVTGATIPTTLFTAAATGPSTVEVSGVDLSALAAGKNLASVGTASTGPTDVYFRNCKLGASVSVITGTVVGPGSYQVFLENCDSGNTNYRMERYKYQGSVVQEIVRVETGGASDGTTPISHKFVSLATGPTLFSPLEGPWMTAWNETLTALTAVVDFLHDSATNLKDSDIYLEVEYLGTSGFPKSVYSNDRVADIFATAVDCDASSATWTTTGMGNPNKQQLSVGFTPTVKGPIRFRVCLAKANYTVYVNPAASGLAATSREYLIPVSVYVNETAPAVTFPPAYDVYSGVDRGDGVLGTLHASNIATAAGAGSNLAAGDLRLGTVVDNVTGTLDPSGGGGGGGAPLVAIGGTSYAG